MDDDKRVEKVQKVLEEDSDLLIEFYTTIEKAIAKAGVRDFSLDDRVELLRKIADRLKRHGGPGKAPSIRWYWFEPPR